MDVARGNARRYAYDAFGLELEDLREEALPDLQHYDVAECEVVDAVTPAAISALGLTPSYPTGIPHPPCQAIAEQAYADGERGIAVLSATSTRGEELVIFDREVTALTTKTIREPFGRWFYLKT